MKRLITLLLLCVPAGAEAVRLPVRVVAPGTVHITLYRTDATAPPVEVDLQRGDASIDLSDGTWRLDAAGAGLWHKRQYINVPSAARAEIRLWPAATLAGEVALADSKDSAEQLTVRFDVRDGPSGDETCAVVAKHFNCTLPAGTADLALRVRSHVTQYVGPAELPAGTTRDLGRLTFVPGATLAGRVEPPRGVKVSLDAVTVTASPAGGATIRLSSLSAHPNAKGFFHLDGIAPGQYAVAAATRRPQMSSPATSVLVVAGAEAALNRPLVMSPTRPLTISITPPLDPWGKPWRVQMARELPSETVPMADALVAMTGSYQSEPLHAGRYEIRVGPQDNSVWRIEEIDVDDRTSTLLIPLHLIRLHGTVHLGDKPLAAAIWIGGRFGAPRIEMHSDESGTFEGFVPPRDGDTWPVWLQSDAPPTRRNFEAVRLRRREDGDLQVDLRLDLTMVQGDVVDENGAPQPQAFVNVSSKGGQEFAEQTQGATTPDGRFALYGLRPGKYAVSATTYLHESRPADFEIRAGEDPPTLRLVVLPNRQLKGVVRSAVGPVAGANVTSWPADVQGNLLMTAHSDEAGRFAEIITPGAEQLDVLVEPPGFALKMFHVHWDDQQLVIPVRQDGGRLTVEGIPSADAVIEHNGATLYLVSLTFRAESSRNGDRTTVANLEPGNYTVCRAADRGRCASGFLPPYGTLDLRLAAR